MARLDNLQNLKLLGEVEKEVNLVDLNKPQLVVVDMINGFCKEGILADKEIMNIVPAINNLIRGIDRVTPENKNFRSNVIFLKDSHNEFSEELKAFPPHCMGDKESEIVDEINTNGFSNIFEKNSTNGFFSKGFHEYFNKLVSNELVKFVRDPNSSKNKLDIPDFIITGCCTDICVMTLALSIKTYFNQFNMDAKVIVPIDCVDTYDTEGVHNAKDYNEMALALMKQQGIIITEKIVY